jgi:hypothetical protein
VGCRKSLRRSLFCHFTHKIENSCHWALDVVFGEDLSRVRVGNAAENLAILRRLALNLLKTAQDRQCGRPSQAAQGCLGQQLFAQNSMQLNAIALVCERE